MSVDGDRHQGCGPSFTPDARQHVPKTRRTGIPEKTETCIRIMDMPDKSPQRRPQWRGERKAILIRVPVTVADELAAIANESSESVSDAAGRLLSVALATRGSGAA